MWEVQDVGYARCGMFEMWNVQNVGCLGCGMWDVGCLLGYGMLIYKMPWARIWFLWQASLKQPESFVEYIEKLAEWIEFCSHCLIIIFRHFLLLMELIIIFEDEFLFPRYFDLILMSRYVSATWSILRKLWGIDLKIISINFSSVSWTLLIHDLICAMISRTHVLLCLSMISSFCILVAEIIH